MYIYIYIYRERERYIYIYMYIQGLTLRHMVHARVNKTTKTSEQLKETPRMIFFGSNKGLNEEYVLEEEEGSRQDCHRLRKMIIDQNVRIGGGRGG